jgi:signal transduction histidine kinase
VKKRSSIYRKYVLLVVALVGGALIVSGIASMYRSYIETRSALLAVEREHAVSASIRIENFIQEIERQIGWTLFPQADATTDPLVARRNDLVKLGVQVKAITEATYIDAQGRAQLRESRLEMTVKRSGIDLSDDPRFKVASQGRTYFGPVYFRNESEPYMAIAVPARRQADGVTAVEVNLKFMQEVIERIHVGKTGFAYVVDRQGRLIAHRDISLVLQKTDLSTLPQVKAALSRKAAGGEQPLRVTEARDRAGKSVLTAYAVIEALGWTVFVEQSVEEAYAPLYASLARTGALLVAGLLLSMLAGLVFARRMVNPIRALQEGADALGAGDLTRRIDVRTGDELEALGERFNEMAGRLAASYAGLERKVEERTRELQDTLEQQTATAEILRSISSSPSDVTPVFETMLDSAARLCDSPLSGVFRYEDGIVHLVSHRNWSPLAIEEMRKDYPAPPNAKLMSGRTILAGTLQQEEDALSDPDYDHSVASAGGWRRMLGVPIKRGARVLGAVVVAWPTPGKTPERQVRLLEIFSDQAAIAIENVRLFNETKEALERQTATADILQIISGSPTDVQPVFDTIVQHAVRLCDSQFANVFRYDGEQLHFVASHNVVPAQLDVMKGKYPMRADLSQVSGRVVLHRAIERMEDALSDSSYDRRFAELGGWRRMLGVPMIREGNILGAIVVGWREAGPVSPTHEALLRTFADQAAIAIENVRLFHETNEALEHQKASAEVLEVISGSVADTQPVFDKILASCNRLFQGTDVGINIVGEDGALHLAAYAGPKKAELERHFPVPLSTESGSGLAILERKVLHYPDTQADSVPEYARRGSAITGSKSQLFAPMLWEGRGIGAILVGRDFVGEFSAKEIALLRTFADQAVIAIQNARLFHEIEEKSNQLEVANKHKSDFLANMSHELRTPLNAIIGFSEVLIEKMFGEVNEKQADYLNDIHSSGRHLLSLINDILDLSKIEAGRMELDLVDLSLPDALSNAMTLIRERAQNHGIALTLHVDPTVGEIRADERKVKQVMLNLLSNAVKFTPDGGTIAVRATLDTDHIEVAVKDSGIGIAPEDQEAVFEEFKQVGRDYTKKAEGTGLGLALTRRIVELHGGRIWLESAPGKGSTFTFTLPLTQQEETQ